MSVEKLSADPIDAGAARVRHPVVQLFSQDSQHILYSSLSLGSQGRVLLDVYRSYFFGIAHGFHVIRLAMIPQTRLPLCQESPFSPIGSGSA